MYTADVSHLCGKIFVIKILKSRNLEEVFKPYNNINISIFTIDLPPPVKVWKPPYVLTSVGANWNKKTTIIRYDLYHFKSGCSGAVSGLRFKFTPLIKTSLYNNNLRKWLYMCPLFYNRSIQHQSLFCKNLLGISKFVFYWTSFYRCRTFLLRCL